ncbi:UDP-N-acetylglucosamine 1-carboxyvinyltransferase [Brevundimonas balnearis]|uniref:UDP-N-acetylglucosamine 1-carboxyvinyltransferase n=1 Tax=Brevundimonas balnearis TaxID=1572858 RepID=A0ABV6QZV6_9CAUL
MSALASATARSTSTLTVARSRLEGRVTVSGAKNSVLRLLAASLLTGDEITLNNYPAGLLDAIVHVGMLEALGKECVTSGSTLTIRQRTAPPSELVWEGRSIRNTLLILGALVARTGSGAVPAPGGCQLGDRKIDIHEMLLRALGAEVTIEDGMLRAHAPNGLVGTDIHLPLRSTGATENAILCGTLAHGVTRIWNPHVRPEILDLIAMLRSMGARITVRGQESIEVHGVDALGGARHRVVPDNMEAITWMIGAVMTAGDVEIRDFPFDHLEVPLIFLRESGAKFYRGTDDSLIVRGGECFPVEISTGPYPGINSDMQPLFGAYACLAQGRSKLIDLRFVGRYGYADEFARMGVRTSVEDGVLVIDGGAPVSGTDVTALDLRAGMALTLLGMCADGETTIHDAWQIERGYDALHAKLATLGASVRQ